MSGRRQPQPDPASPATGWVVLLSVVAIVISLAAVAFTVLRSGSGTADTSCRTLAWDALPDGSGLPDGWTVTAGNFYADGAGTSLVGPAAADGSAPDTLYLQVTCYGADGHLAMTRSHESALAAGASDAPLLALGDESFSTEDPSNASTSVYVRRGGLVAVLVAPTSLDPADLEQAARAVDTALGTAGSVASRPSPTIRVPVASPSGAVESPTEQASDEPIPSDAHAAPELEALLPKAVAGVTLSRESTDGTQGLGGTDASSQALVASLAKLGKKPADLLIAVAYDQSQATDLQISAFQLAGIKGSTLGQAIADSYTAGAASAVTSTPQTISGKAVTHVVYDTGYPDDYVYVHGDVVFDVATSDAASAIQAFAALP